MQNKTVLITGGAGFIGRNLANIFVDKGYKVIILDNLSSGFIKSLNKKVILIQGSILDEKALTKSFKFKPKKVIHLAALFANQNSVEHPETDLRVNGTGTLKLLQFCKKYSVKKIIYTSSSCVYGNKKKMKENDPLKPGTPYAITKLLGEFYVKFWSEYYNMNIVVVRLFNVYGPGDYPGKYRSVIPNFIQSAIEKKSLKITGTGKETRDFTYIDDVTNIIYKLSNIKKNQFDIINIGSGKSENILNIAKIINKISQNQKKVLLKKARKWDDVPHRSANNIKLKKYIKNYKFTSIENGLKKTYKWMQMIKNNK